MSHGTSLTSIPVQEYNIYCDESCHLLRDNSPVMVLGALWCLKAKRQEAFARIREIKQKHGLAARFELKWNKVSPAKTEFYLEILNYFFDDDDMHFRALIVPDKDKLEHAADTKKHDQFYYKMYFDLLKVILEPDCSYNIYLDIKDTQGNEKVERLMEVLRNNHYDYHKQIVRKLQQVRSHEVEILQLTDLLTGAIGYLHRGLSGNSGKLQLIEKMKSRSGYSLTQSTLYKEDKMNIFVWKSKAAE